MSYGYNNYSPYLNQQSEQDSRNQYLYQTSNTGQRHSYTAPTGSINGQQRPSPSNDLSQFALQGGSSSRYSGSGADAYHGARSNSNHNVATEHTTGLSGLAYASSLRRDQSSNEQERASLQRIADFNRSHSRESLGYYGQPIHQRSDSRGSGNGRGSESQHTTVNRTASPYQRYAAQALITTHGNQNAAYSSVSETRPTGQHVPRPTRPTSGQSNYVSNSPAALKPNQSPRPTVHGSSTINQIQNQNQGSPENGSYRPPEADKRESVNGGLTKQPAQLISPAIQRRDSLKNTQVTTSGHEQEFQSIPPTNPTTIDPNKVFNWYEYQRRQDAAAAEAKAAREKAAAEAKQRRKSEQMAALTNPASTASGTQMAQDEDSRKELMEAEMKLMLEKMREYKSKDPTLFSQIWEQVKKAQPPTALPASKEVSIASPRSASTSIQNPVKTSVPTAQESSAVSIPMAQSAAPVPQPSSASIEQDQGRSSPKRRVRRQTKRVKPAVRSFPTQSPTQGPPEGYVRAGENRDSTSNEQTEKARVPVNTTNDVSTAPQSISTPHRPSGQTHWPEEEKWALAIAAKETLLSHPANRDKQIRAHDIRCLLDQGPSYDELCGMLEQKGFVIERTPFAQRLLACVPRLKEQRPLPPPPRAAEQLPPSVQSKSISQANGKSNSKPRHEKTSDATKSVQKPKAPETPIINNIPKATPAPIAPMYGMLVKNQQHQQPNINVQAGHKTTSASNENNWHVRFSENQNHSQPRKDHQVPQPIAAKLSHAHPIIGTSIQPTKQQMAKKRSFAEIVDLTADMNSDEERERARAEKLRQDNSSKVSQSVSSSEQLNESVSLPTKTVTSTLSATQNDGEDVELSHFKGSFSPEQERLREADVVKPLSRADALQRDFYDPRTIARDILVATGKHPHMAPLNYHLHGLRTIFRNVDNTSDLSTLNWELIDPGGPAPKQGSPDITVLHEAEQSVVEHEAPPQVVEHIEPAVVVPVNNGERADVKNSQSKKSSKPSSESGSPKFFREISKRRFPGLGVDALPRQQHEPSDRDNPQGDVSMLAAGESGADGLLERYRTDISLSTPPDATTNRQISVLNNTGKENPNQSQRRHSGRPRGSKNKDPLTRKSRGSDVNLQTPAQAASSSASASASSDNSIQPSTPMTSHFAFRNPTATPARSSGLRNEISRSPGFAVVIPSPAAKTRPDEGKISRSSVPSRKHHVYKCRWKDCPGELHNLETLRKHTYNHIHDFDEDVDDIFQCLWDGCAASDGRGRLQFKSVTSWHRHMDGRHLDPFAWEFGDGPSPHPPGK